MSWTRCANEIVDAMVMMLTTLYIFFWLVLLQIVDDGLGLWR